MLPPLPLLLSLPALQWGCCDMVYLPALEFFNVVGYSQDRYATGEFVSEEMID